jgi:hypothetical protein
MRTPFITTFQKNRNKNIFTTEYPEFPKFKNAKPSGPVSKPTELPGLKVKPKPETTPLNHEQQSNFD